MPITLTGLDTVLGFLIDENSDFLFYSSAVFFYFIFLFIEGCSRGAFDKSDLSLFLPNNTNSLKQKSFLTSNFFEE